MASAMRPRLAPLLTSALVLIACNPPSEIAPSDETGSTTTGSSSSGTGGDSTTASLDTTVGTGSATGGATGSSTTSALDDTGTSESSSGPDESSSESTGPAPDNGCADGEREAFVDEVAYPDIAACSGGWMVPGLHFNVTYCDRDGGDDGPLPAGQGCSVEDLCSEGWHVCMDRQDVMASGVDDCNDEAYGGAFFATRQSSMGGHFCTATGVDDIFGCGDIGWSMLNDCAPLNRDSQNLCNELPEPWSCDISSTQEAEFVVKEGPEFGGVLCCRD